MSETMTQTPRAVIYTRVSPGEQAEHGTSLSEQLAACQKKVNDLKATIVAVYEDPGVSGSLYLARPGIQAALRDIEAGRADTLIIANLSRFSRDREHQSAIKKRVEAAGGRLVFCDMTFEDTPEGDLAFGIMGTFADYERQVIRARTMRGRRRRAEQDGLQPSRARSPFGYHVVTNADVLRGQYAAGTLGTYQVVEEQAHWIRAIFTQYAAGASLRQLCRLLHEGQVPTPRGGRCWNPSTVRAMLENPAYKGTPAFGRTQRKTDETRLQRGMQHPDYHAPLPEDRWHYLTAPALVDERTWQACQERLRENQTTLGGNPERRYLLSGLLRCPRCHRGLFGHREDERHTYYQCRDSSPAKNVAGAVCNPRRYSSREAEGTVLGMLRRAAREPQRFREALQAFEQTARQDDSAQDLERTHTELIQLDVREKATVQAQIAGMQAGASAAAYMTVFTEIAAERTALQERLRSLEAQRPEAAQALRESETERASAVLADVDEALEAPELTPAERHGLLRQIVADVYPEGDGYRVRLRTNDNSGQNITMFPARDDNDSFRRKRIAQWRDRLPPDTDWAPGDPRGWEQTHGRTADLTPLGRKLLGLDAWE